MTVNIIVKWAGKEYSIEDIDSVDTVMDLKVKIMAKTGVKPERQKLLNLKSKGLLNCIIMVILKASHNRKNCHR